MIDKIKEAYNKHYEGSKYTLDSDFVSFEAGYKEGEIAERNATKKMLEWAVYYWNLTQPELDDEDEECKRIDAKREDFKRIIERARSK